MKAFFTCSVASATSGALPKVGVNRYRIEEAPQAFADLESGRNARGVIVF